MPGPAGPDRRVGRDDRRRRGGRLPAAARRPPAGVRPRRASTATPRGLPRQRLAVRAVLPGRARGAPGRRPPGRRPPPPRLAGRARRAIFRASRYADDPIVGGRGDRHDAPQPRLPRLDRRTRRSPSSACAPGDAASRRRTPTGSTCWPPASRRAELVNTVSPGYAARGADARVRDGPRRPAARARATGSSGSSTGSTPTVWDPATDADLAAPYSRGDLAGQGRLPGGPAGARRVRPGRRRAGPRDDRAARPAEGLRPARRRGADAAGARRAARSSRAAATRRSPTRSGRSPRHRRAGSRSSSGSTARWPAGSTPAPTSS